MLDRIWATDVVLIFRLALVLARPFRNPWSLGLRWSYRSIRDSIFDSSWSLVMVLVHMLAFVLTKFQILQMPENIVKIVRICSSFLYSHCLLT